MMRKTAYLLLTIALAFVCAEAKPPFGGTIFVSRNIITAEDPTAFKSLTAAGRGRRRMFDRRARTWVRVNAHLFTARFDDGQTMEVQVNPEFDSKQALEQAKKYLPVIGQLPSALRKDVETVWIHKGKHGFGGGNRNLLIHTGMGEAYIKQGILAETFYHEASHTSLDKYHAGHKDWIAAQKKDPEFISGYAKNNPTREDIAETYLLYFALRYKPHRIDDKLKETIKKTVPNRIAYFDSLKLDMHPVRPHKGQPGRTPAAGKPTVYTKWPFDAKEAKRRQEETAKALNAKTTSALNLAKGVTMKLVLVPAGKFMMGSPRTEVRRKRDEGPQHKVTLSAPFYMGVTEVTQAQWKALMNTQPWDGKEYVKAGADNAANNISWDNATAFCAALSKKTGRTVRLPTEAEWEYASRAGAATAYSFGDSPAKLGDYAWYDGNTKSKGENYAHPVGVKKPNVWGLHDMHGNVEEWCADWYAESYLPAKTAAANVDARDPKGPAAGKWRVLRGGRWSLEPRHYRAAARYMLAARYGYFGSGFRVVVAPGSGVD